MSKLNTGPDQFPIREEDKIVLLMALLCRLGERVTLSTEEVNDLRRGRYDIEFSRSDSLNDDTFTLQLVGGEQ